MNRRESIRPDIMITATYRLVGFRGLLLILAGALVMVSPIRLAAAESTQTLTAALQPFVANHTLAGAVVLVASSDRVLALDAVGYMDIAANRPMRTDALFWIASQSKPMTVAALMMLVDEGEVKLDDPVEKYLPEFKGQWVKAEGDAEHLLLKQPVHPITVRNVLSHTSGLPFSSLIEQPTSTCFRSLPGFGATPCCRWSSSRIASTPIPTPASTLPGASSRW